MSAALYIVLDQEDPGFDTFVNGKAIANETKNLALISQKLNIRSFDDFISLSSEELEDMLEADIDIPNDEIKWFTPIEGITFIETILTYIKSNPTSVTNQKDILKDLEEYLAVFQKAKEISARWHLKIDI